MKELSGLALFLVWSVRDAHVRLGHHPQPLRSIGAFTVTMAHFLDKGLLKFISQRWLRRITIEELVFCRMKG